MERNEECERPVSREEIHELTRRSNWAGAWAIGSTWAVILGTFAVLAIWPNPLTFLVVVVVHRWPPARRWRS